jgi:hypothetical protein
MLQACGLRSSQGEVLGDPNPESSTRHQGCSRRPIFSERGTPPTFCAQHKQPSHAYTSPPPGLSRGQCTHVVRCGRAPSHGERGGLAPRYCKGHKQPHHIDLRAARRRWERRVSPGAPGAPGAGSFPAEFRLPAGGAAGDDSSFWSSAAGAAGEDRSNSEGVWGLVDGLSSASSVEESSGRKRSQHSLESSGTYLGCDARTSDPGGGGGGGMARLGNDMSPRGRLKEAVG